MTLSKIKLTKEERKEAVLKAQVAREKIFKLVVKIISWDTGPLDRALNKTKDKITSEEWLRYRQHLLGISKTVSVKKVKERLDAIYESIKTRGGFK